jgi:hypothetical protein
MVNERSMPMTAGSHPAYGQHTAKGETKIVGQDRWRETVRLRCPQ